MIEPQPVQSSVGSAWTPTPGGAGLPSACWPAAYAGQSARLIEPAETGEGAGLGLGVGNGDGDGVGTGDGLGDGPGLGALADGDGLAGTGVCELASDELPQAASTISATAACAALTYQPIFASGIIAETGLGANRC